MVEADEEWSDSSGMGAGTERVGGTSGAETARAIGEGSSAGVDGSRRERGRRSELDRDLRASQAATGTAKSSGPESPRLRQSSSTSPSTLPLMRRSAPGARSREREGRSPGERCCCCSAEDEDDHDAPTDADALAPAPASYSMRFTALRRSNRGLRPRLPLPLPLPPPPRLLESMEASAPPRRRLEEEDDDEGEPEEEEDCLRLHENIWIHTRSAAQTY